MPGKCSITEPYIHLKRIFYLIFLKKNKDVFNILFMVISNSQESSNRKDKNILLILLHSILPNVNKRQVPFRYEDNVYWHYSVRMQTWCEKSFLCVAFIG